MKNIKDFDIKTLFFPLVLTAIAVASFIVFTQIDAADDAVSDTEVQVESNADDASAEDEEHSDDSDHSHEDGEEHSHDEESKEETPEN